MNKLNDFRGDIAQAVKTLQIFADNIVNSFAESLEAII